LENLDDKKMLLGRPLAGEIAKKNTN